MASETLSLELAPLSRPPSEPISASNSAITSSANSTHPSLRRQTRADIQIQALSVQTTPSSVHRILCFLRQATRRTQTQTQTLAPSTRTILHPATARIPGHKLTAILGGSGSGKTTLLNALVGRTHNCQLKVNGSVTHSGRTELDRSRVAYVSQEDILPAVLTVRETLQYAADLRSKFESAEQRDGVVRTLISRLGLESCADTRIGTGSGDGCSGGERRRVSIAIQLLTGAEVLFCDEPTTGLDAATALQVVRTLRYLADGGITVVISVHAPRSSIWELFDHIVLLREGHLLYDGPRDAVPEYLDRHGYQLPPFVNPAEFLLETASIGKLEVMGTLGLMQGSSKEAFSLAATSPAYSLDTPAQSYRTQTFQNKLVVATKRAMVMCCRDICGLVGIISTVAAMAALTGWIFWQLDGSQAGIRSRQGSLYAATGLYSYLVMVIEICRLLEEVKIFDHERGDGLINAIILTLSRRAGKLVLEDLTLPTLFTGIYYPMVGYRSDVTQIFLFWLITLLTHTVAIGVATISVAITRNFYGAGLVGNMYFTLQTAACGYYLQMQQVPVYVRWIRWVTPTFYTFSVLCTLEFLGPDGSRPGYLYDCPYSGNATDPRCVEYTGAFIMDSLGLPRGGIWKPLVILVSIAVLFHGTAAAIFHFKVVSVSGSKSLSLGDPKPLDGSTEQLDVSIPGAGFAEVRSSVEVHGLELSRRTVKWGIQRHWSRSVITRIVGPISAFFCAGGLNVIMGASGSGKTTFLTALTGRLITSSQSLRDSCGWVTVNGHLVDSADLRGLVSYVPQEDSHLLPTLTVRETLFFAAELRCPSFHPHELRHRVEDLINRFGLQSCANTLVGSSFIKGISGGEKRRLSIACEVVARPNVLVLDEPTSGLDSLTALSIIKILHELSLEGCIIILSIHQPSSAMWKLFSTCLLLNPDGNTVYSGGGDQMLSYFRSLGHVCPHEVNPADFFIDLATCPLAETDISTLVEKWQQYQSPVLRPLEPLIPDPSILKARSGKRNTRFLRMTLTLLHRASLNSIRNPLSIIARLVQAPGVGIIWTLFVAPLHSDYKSVQTRMGLIQQFTALGFIGMLQNIATFPPELLLLEHESSAHLYGAAAFLTQYTFLEVPFELFSSAIYSILLAYACGLASTPSQLGVCFLSALCTLNTGESLSMLVCLTFGRIIALSVSFTCAVLSIFTVLGGGMSLDPPRLLEWLNHINPVKYVIENVSYYCVKGLELHCEDDQRRADGSCPLGSGQEVLALYGLDTRHPERGLIAGVALMLGYRVVVWAVLMLQARRRDGRGFRPWSGAGRRNTEDSGV
ncbi:hypothetical protein BDW74DRAFT_182201 [Aspergillus multicolor]|uniref:putative ABC efflux transporter n=1 Tax=Aspergillus multicolor TaxID=41759 RepID=UPI003CCC94E8